MFRTGIGYDVHTLVAGRPCILGGVTIPHPVGPDGHSDADVLCHAIADALLERSVNRTSAIFFHRMTPVFAASAVLKSCAASLPF